MVNQVLPSRTSVIDWAQGLNSNVQRIIRIPNNKTLPNEVNFASTFFQYSLKRLSKNRKRLDVVNYVLFRPFFDNVGNLAHRQIVVPPETTEAIVRTMHGDPYKDTLELLKC